MHISRISFSTFSNFDSYLVLSTVKESRLSANCPPNFLNCCSCTASSFSKFVFCKFNSDCLYCSFSIFDSHICFSFVLSSISSRIFFVSPSEFLKTLIPISSISCFTKSNPSKVSNDDLMNLSSFPESAIF